NIFLSKSYLKVLENSAPKNMICSFIGLYKSDVLVGIAISQMLSIANVSSFGVNKSCIKSKIRDLVFRKFANNILFVGNNMLTGQNAFYFSDQITFHDGLHILNKAVIELQKNFKKQGQQIHILNFKDFSATDSKNFETESFSNYYKFEIQPNMVFDIPEHWNNQDDYVNALSKKYRDQYKRARKKSDGILKRKLSLEEIISCNGKINELYLNVTKNAPFNTFYLSENHFVTLKKELGHDFLFYGYFIDNELIGFNTLIKNGNVIDTYFLGYSDDFQREKMLYLNMLYDMIGYSINKKFRKIIFARTALEIKSSVGAKPEKMFGYIKHHNKIVNKFMPNLFKYFEPEVIWQERNPFK
uniref:8-amino-7-oxononanoate synthase n=1 Tax=Flavobacterium sp. TaxID=239 RepID=UPI003752C486